MNVFRGNRQVGMRIKQIDIYLHFVRDKVEDKYIEVKYIMREEKPVYIITNNCSEADYIKKTKRITEGELCELVETGIENVKNTGVTDKIIERNKTEYSSHILAEVVYGEKSND